MDELTYVFAFIIMLIIFIISQKKTHCASHNKLNTKAKQQRKKISKLTGGSNKYTSCAQNNKRKIKKLALHLTYHTHFRDILTVIGDLTAYKKKIFNCSNKFVSTTTCNEQTVNKIAVDFVKMLNEKIKKIPEYRSCNSGWDDAIPDKNIKSGWDKHLENLGLHSLYEPDAKNGEYNLLKIDDYQVLSTENQNKYIITMSLEKRNVEDNIMIVGCFVENIHCTKNKTIIDLELEDISVIGFLSDYGDVYEPEMTNSMSYYKFKDTETTDVIDDQTIIAELEKKFVKDMTINNNINNVVMSNGIFKDVPDKQSYDAFKINRTIKDDTVYKDI